VFVPKAGVKPQELPLNATPPATGSTKVDPPKTKAKEPETADAEDFG
jgi:hypothetical protein